MGDVLFHDGRIDCHALGAVLVDDTGLLTRADGLGQQPFDPRQVARTNGAPCLDWPDQPPPPRCPLSNDLEQAVGFFLAKSSGSSSSSYAA